MTYIVKPGDSFSKIARAVGRSVDELLRVNPGYRANPNQINVGDVLNLPDGIPVVAPPPPPPFAAVPPPPLHTTETVGSDADDFCVAKGQLTFDAEGMEQRGLYFSRTAHVPSAKSGVTIGRGYDMKTKSAAKIQSDLVAAGLAEDLAGRFAGAAGLAGEKGKAYIEAEGLSDLEITPAQQKALFHISYAELEADVIRICNEADVLAAYGETHWENLDPRIRDVVVDLRFRGDYRSTSREIIQPKIVAGQLADFREVISDRDIWIGRFGVPQDRFERRRDYLA